MFHNATVLNVLVSAHQRSVAGYTGEYKVEPATLGTSESVLIKRGGTHFRGEFVLKKHALGLLEVA